MEQKKTRNLPSEESQETTALCGTESFGKKLMHLGRLHREATLPSLLSKKLYFGQPLILSCLMREENGLKQTEIAKICKVKASTVTSVLNTMEAAGMIERSNDKDRRVRRVKITENGKEAYYYVEDVIHACDEAALTDFSEEEKATFFNLLSRAEENIKERYNLSDCSKTCHKS